MLGAGGGRDDRRAGGKELIENVLCEMHQEQMALRLFIFMRDAIIAVRSGYEQSIMEKK